MRDHVFVSRLGTFIDTFVKQKRIWLSISVLGRDIVSLIAL